MVSKIKKTDLRGRTSVYAVTSLLNISRAICHGYFSTK